MNRHDQLLTGIIGVTFTFLAPFAYAQNEAVMNIIGVENFSREHCVSIAAGKKVIYEFESAFPVDFNIHFHTDAKTGYKNNKKNIEKIVGEFTSESQQHYCFTWVNKVERGGEWNIILRYKIAP